MKEGMGLRRLSDCLVCALLMPHTTLSVVYVFPLSNVSRPLEEEVVLEGLLGCRGRLRAIWYEAS